VALVDVGIEQDQDRSETAGELVNRIGSQVADCSDEIRAIRRLRGRSSTIFLAKRIFDVVAVIAAAPAALLIVAVSAAAIAISNGRPIFFIQERVGLRGRAFRMIKLRTMTNGRDAAVAASKQDQRVTPQLLNVLKGEMSLIGPRPEQPALVEQYRRLMPEFDERHLVKPGITGLAQVMYGYASNAEETRIKLRYDRYYVKNASLMLEAKIFAKTVKTVLRCEGAR
jgi:lipopolysaccharide/colanic/teichoic acid biosynthesis glycosyltransferase